MSSCPMTEVRMALPANISVGLVQLLHSFDYAAESSSSVWDFASEIGVLRAVGMTLGDFRWLVAKGFVQHGEETSVYGDRHRTFRPAAGLTFPASDCVCAYAPRARRSLRELLPRIGRRARHHLAAVALARDARIAPRRLIRRDSMIARVGPGVPAHYLCHRPTCRAVFRELSRRPSLSRSGKSRYREALRRGAADQAIPRASGEPRVSTFRLSGGELARVHRRSLADEGGDGAQASPAQRDHPP